jgi:hypothetical protein
MQQITINTNGKWEQLILDPFLKNVSRQEPCRSSSTSNMENRARFCKLLKHQGNVFLYPLAQLTTILVYPRFIQEYDDAFISF